MKMSWGYKISILYIIFITGILFMVFRASSVNVELVTDDYYEKELKYQEVIDARNRTQLLSAPVLVKNHNNKVSVFLPEEIKGKEVSADILMYFPLNQDKDHAVSLNTNNGVLVFDMPAGTKGNYVMKLMWKCEGKNYYSEEKILF